VSTVTQWAVYRATLDPVIGSEQRGTRPVLVISQDDFNRLMPTVTILPLTSHKPGRRVYPNEVLLPPGTASLPSASLVLVHQIRTIAKSRLSTYYGTRRASPPGYRPCSASSSPVQPLIHKADTTTPPAYYVLLPSRIVVCRQIPAGEKPNRSSGANTWAKSWGVKNGANRRVHSSRRFR